MNQNIRRKRGRRKHYVYMVLCKNNTIYVGETNNSFRRMMQHYNRGRSAARYIKIQGFKEMIYQEEVQDQSEGKRREKEIIKLSRDEKWQLIEKQSESTKEILDYINNVLLKNIEV